MIVMLKPALLSQVFLCAVSGLWKQIQDCLDPSLCDQSPQCPALFNRLEWRLFKLLDRIARQTSPLRAGKESVDAVGGLGIGIQ